MWVHVSISKDDVISSLHMSIKIRGLALMFIAWNRNVYLFIYCNRKNAPKLPTITNAFNRWTSLIHTHHPTFNIIEFYLCSQSNNSKFSMYFRLLLLLLWSLLKSSKSTAITKKNEDDVGKKQKIHINVNLSRRWPSKTLHSQFLTLHDWDHYSIVQSHTLHRNEYSNNNSKILILSISIIFIYLFKSECES